MKNMKISMKLVVSFVIVIVMAIAVGTTGIISMTNMNNSSTEMYEKQTLPLPYLAKVVECIQRMRVNTREYYIGASLGDSAQIETAHSTIETYSKIMSDNLDAYSATITSAEARQLFDEARSIYDTTYKVSVQKCYELALAGNAAAIQTELAAVKPDTNKMVDNFDRCMEIKTENSKAASDAMGAQARSSLIIIIIVLAAAVIIAMFLAFYVSSLISKPMVFMKDILAGFGTQGNLTLSDAEYDRAKKIAAGKDEVAQSMAMLLATFLRLSKVGQALETVAGGDLTVELNLLSDKDSMGRSLHTMLDNLNNMFSEINSATAQVSIGSKQIADGAQSLAQGSTEQASAVQELSASISEIADKTKENAEMAMHAANLAGNIKQNAEKGNMQMDQMMQAVKEINEASQSISRVIGVIDNIAFQTNILALNAAVEAARAGQHGKGFAVVAEEVRSLASKSAEAAKETGALIANSMDKAEMGARIADETASSLVEIVSGINESTRIVGDIAQSSNAQASAITEINSGIDQVAQVVQQNSATAQQSAAASEQMSGQADSLEQLIAQFKLKDSHQRSLGAGPRKAQRGIPENISYDGDSGLGMGKY